MSKLLIVGTVAFDAVETPFGKTEKTLGGAATYIGLSASHFRVASGIVSIVGGDFPSKHLEMLQAKNIDVSGIQVVQEGKTFFWKGRYHNNMNSRDTLETALNVLENFHPVVPQNFRDPSIVMLGNLHPSVQHLVLEQLTQVPKLVVLDTMNFWMDCALSELKKVLKKVDVLTINDEEARQLSGVYSLVLAAKKIQEMGPQYVVIKKGEHGALLFYKDRIFAAPALPLEQVVDPTGAGDTFAGGFSGYLAKTQDFRFENIKNAVIYGSNLASFCVEKLGTERMLSLSKKEVEDRLSEFRELTHYAMEDDGI